MKNFAIMLALLLATVSVSAQNTKKQDWAQFYVFQKDNARIAEMIKDTPKGKCPKCEWKLRKIKAVLMGDSITELWWDLDSTFFRDNNFVGRGISGQTTSEMLVRFRRDVLDLNPQYVFIMAGTNDVAENNGKITLENWGISAAICEKMCSRLQPAVKRRYFPRLSMKHSYRCIKRRKPL